MPKTKDPSIHGVISYKVFFEKPAPTGHIDILSKYPTDVLIIILSKVNAILFQNLGSPQTLDNEVFRHVFNKMPPIVYRHIDKLRTGKKMEGAIFTQQSIVKLMGKLIARYRPMTDKDVINDSGVELMMMELFESILVINGEYYERKSEANFNSLDHIWEMEMLQQEYVRKFGDMFGVISLKVFLFIRFISERFGEDVLKEFSDAFGVPSPYNFYFAFLETVSSSYTQYDQDGQPRYTITDKVLERVFSPFIFDPSKPQKTPFSGETYVLINQPFYRFSQGIVVLDFDFFSHLTDISFIYNFYQQTSLKRNHGIANYNEYMGLVGKHFYEEYLVLQIIQKQFKHKFDIVQSDKDDPLNPDILIIQNNKDVFVIEVKSSRIHAKVLDQLDIQKFQLYLQENFASEKTQPGEKNKGIYQLKKQIKHLKTKGEDFRVFPIIIYTEPAMDISGVNSFLDEQFEKLIASEKPYFAKIYPLTCINLHFFIKYFLELKNERYFLRDRIIEYHRRKRENLKKASKTNNPFIYFKGQYSFMRKLEQTYCIEDPMIYFNEAAKCLGFE